jgi:hypothetical protein
MGNAQDRPRYGFAAPILGDRGLQGFENANPGHKPEKIMYEMFSPGYSQQEHRAELTRAFVPGHSETATYVSQQLL